MIKRLCADCGGELSQAISSGQQKELGDRSGLVKTAYTCWRCTTCGHTFTAEQARQGVRDRSKAIGH